MNIVLVLKHVNLHLLWMKLTLQAVYRIEVEGCILYDREKKNKMVIESYWLLMQTYYHICIIYNNVCIGQYISVL